MITANEFVVFLVVSGIIWWGYWIWRIVSPLTCACGYRSVFIAPFKRHLLMGHKWVEPHA